MVIALAASSQAEAGRLQEKLQSAFEGYFGSDSLPLTCRPNPLLHDSISGAILATEGPGCVGTGSDESECNQKKFGGFSYFFTHALLACQVVCDSPFGT